MVYAWHAMWRATDGRTRDSVRGDAGQVAPARILFPQCPEIGVPSRTTSHRYCGSSSGCQYEAVFISRSPSSFSSAFQRHLVTWLRTVNSSPTAALADFDQQTQRHVSCAARPTSSATDASQLPVHGYAGDTLLIRLRQCHSLEQFKRLLKTFLFSV